MQASKVQLTSTTLAQLKNPTLSAKKKHALRVQAAIDYIRTRPAGTSLTRADIGRAVGMKSQNYGDHSRFVDQLVSRKILTPHYVTKYKAVYAVTADIKVKNPATTSTTIKQIPPPVAPKTPTLAEYAKNFAWDRDSDSLREFITWMDGKELELRRLSDGQA